MPKTLELFLLNVILIISLFVTAVSLMALNERTIEFRKKRKEGIEQWLNLLKILN